MVVEVGEGHGELHCARGHVSAVVGLKLFKLSSRIRTESRLDPPCGSPALGR